MGGGVGTDIWYANIVGPEKEEGVWGQTFGMLILGVGVLGHIWGLFNVHIMGGGGVLGQKLGMLIV